MTAVLTEHRRITGSMPDAVAECPGSIWLATHWEPDTIWAGIGKEAHTYYEHGTVGPATWDLFPRFQRPEERAPGAYIHHEWRWGVAFDGLAYDGAPPSAEGPRDYAQWDPAKWLVGSADAVWVEGDTLVAEDLKTGKPLRLAITKPRQRKVDRVRQLTHVATGALGMLGQASPIKRVRLQILNATRYDYRTDPKAAGNIDMQTLEMSPEDLVNRWREDVQIPALVAISPEVGKDPQAHTKMGGHCFFCHAKGNCDTYRAKQSPARLEHLERWKSYGPNGPTPEQIAEYEKATVFEPEHGQEAL